MSPIIPLAAVALLFATAKGAKAAAPSSKKKKPLATREEIQDVADSLPAEARAELSADDIESATKELGTVAAKKVLVEVAKKKKRNKRLRRKKRQPTKQEKKIKGRRAAVALRDYLKSRQANFGTKDNPSRIVARQQRRMGMNKSDRDGIVGPRTRAAAKRYGVTLPPRRATTTRATTTRSKDVADLKAFATRTSLTTNKPAGFVAKEEIEHDRAESRKRPRPKKAARGLRAYLRKPGANFGTRKRPSRKVRRYQKKMGGITADGIVGPQTRTRAKALGVILPERRRPGSPVAPRPPALRPPAPGDAPDRSDLRTPTEAAEDLNNYLREPRANFGTRDNRSAVVAEAQKDMGGLTADGIVGPNTRARAKALGVSLPARR